MFGILEKMDRFSNKLMSQEEKIDFMQEIIDNGMVWDMHKKYRNEALTLIGAGDIIAPLAPPVFGCDEKDAGGYNPFDTSLCG